MKAFVDMLHLLNREHEDVVLVEKLKRFNIRLNKEGGDIKNAISLCESLYDDLTRMNKQYPYLNDILLTMIDILENTYSESKKNKKKLNVIAHKNHELRDTIESVKTIPRIKCNTIIKGSYQMIAQV